MERRSNMDSLHSVLCRVRGDQRVRIKQTHRVIEEMGSIVGDAEVLQDDEGDSCVSHRLDLL